MKNLLILSLIIPVAYTHAMDHDHDVPENETRSSQSTDGTNSSVDFDLEMAQVATRLTVLKCNVAELRVKAIALESVVRMSAPGFAEFELLSKLNFNSDGKTQAALISYANDGLRKKGLSQEQQELARQSIVALSSISHEEAVLMQAVKEMQSILSEHKSTHESTPGWCELL